MVKQGGWTHSPETKARLAALMRSRSAEISERTKQRMADPAVRQRIRDGMRAASGEADELKSLQMAWSAARPGARATFLVEITRANAESRQPLER